MKNCQQKLIWKTHQVIGVRRSSIVLVSSLFKIIICYKSSNSSQLAFSESIATNFFCNQTLFNLDQQRQSTLVYIVVKEENYRIAY